MASKLSHAIKRNDLVGVVHYSTLAFLGAIQLCNISLVAQNESVCLCFTRSGGRILDSSLKVAIGSCTLASLTNCPASVKLPSCTTANRDKMNIICWGMRGLKRDRSEPRR